MYGIIPVVETNFKVKMRRMKGWWCWNG